MKIKAPQVSKDVFRRIKAAREARGLSLTEVALNSGLPLTSCWRLEHASDLEQVNRLLAVLHGVGLTIQEVVK